MKFAVAILGAFVFFMGSISSIVFAEGNTPSEGSEKEYWTEPVTGMKFVWVEEGCFQMGQSIAESRLLIRSVGDEDYHKYYADELPLHKVCLDGFWMGIYEVTQAQWQKVMEFNPSHFKDNPDFPLDMVSWLDAIEFIEKLNQTNSEGVIRLPTEAEWEYAARAGTSSPFFTGEIITSKQANFNGSVSFGLNMKDNYLKSPTVVGSFPPNGLGIYDMNGNVWEWCNDWYGLDYYKLSSEKNPEGPENGQMKVLRGGSWFRFAGNIRSATRYKNKQVGQYADTGFRLVRSELKISKEVLTFDPDF
ncbi:MAG: formylglycine-generating enzyme family protein [Proteobacteria bacterium]|nr:formylglycine-generating enzyme family protein [Pseudomonadota bacterium]MBU1686498.1 formylglycine-generating enzyme family protein [Pseudomonadota bacterium]